MLLKLSRAFAAAVLLNPSDVFVSAATYSPTPSPTDSPSESPSVSRKPTIPKSQDINMTALAVDDDGSNNITATYERARGWSKTTVNILKLDDVNSECDLNANPDEDTIAYLPEEDVGGTGKFFKNDGKFITWTQPANDDGSGGPMNYFDVEFDIKENELVNSPFWFNDGDDSKGTIAFCARADLWQDFGEDSVSMGFHMQKVLVSVDISNTTIIFSDIAATLNDIQNVTDDFDSSVYTVTGYLCNRDRTAAEALGDNDFDEDSTITVEQNSAFYLCLKPSKPEVKISSITINSVKNQAGEQLDRYFGINNNVPNQDQFVKFVYSSNVNNEYMTEMWSMFGITDLFRTDGNPGSDPSLTFAGYVKLTFRQAGRRLINNDGEQGAEHEQQQQRAVAINLRGLQQAGDSITSPLSLEIDLSSDSVKHNEDVKHNIFHGAHQDGQDKADAHYQAQGEGGAGDEGQEEGDNVETYSAAAAAVHAFKGLFVAAAAAAVVAAAFVL